MIRNRARGMMLENDQIEGERTPEQSWGRRALQPLLWFMVLTVLVVSLLPGSALPSKTALLWDKAQHALAFAMLCGIGMKAYPDRVRDVALGLLLLGGLIEFAQAAMFVICGAVRMCMDATNGDWQSNCCHRAEQPM